MLKREIKYTDFDGNEAVDVCYFNLTKVEILEYQLEYPGNFIQRIVETKDLNGIMREIKKLVLLAYGVRSDDGKRFIKNNQLREEFTQTPAFDALYMELISDEKLAADFILGLVPADMRGEMAKEMAVVTAAPILPPPPPTI